jgi:hypothetical protein
LDGPRGGVESLDSRCCASQHEIQGHFPPQITANNFLKN